tara:strand:+ start:7675 stop:8244 length:570 start_codon:yes stop_codon:yes gene_type:complete
MASSGGRSEYFKKYYEKNKERILTKKKEVYKDPVIKRRIKAQRDKDRARERKIKLLLSKADKTEKVIKGMMMRVVHPEDPSRSAVVEMFYMGKTAEIATVPKKTFLSWVSNNRVPTPLYRTARGWRVYTEYEVAIMSKYLIWYRKSLWMRGYRLQMSQDASDDLAEKFSCLVGGIPEDKYIKTETEDQS